MIKLSFTYNCEILNFAINDREIWYKDRIWKNGIRCIPLDDNFVYTIKMSRNKLPSYLINMFKLSEKDEEEYKNCDTEEELAKKIIEDCQKQGLILLKEDI